MIKQIVCTLTLISVANATEATSSNHLAEYWRAQAIKASQVAVLNESLTSKQKQMIEAVGQLEQAIQLARGVLQADCESKGLILGGPDGVTCVEGTHPDTLTKTK